jgi:uridine kinase
LKPYLVAIAGGSGSGKTTIVDRVKAMIPNVDVLIFNGDHYYTDLSHLPIERRSMVNFDHPDAIDNKLLIDHVQKLMNNEPVERPTYDFNLHTRLEKTETLQPAKFIFFDSIFALYHPEIRELCSMRFFVDVGDDLRFIRRLTRDIKERSRSVESVVDQYLTSVRPMYLKYIAPTKRYADMVIYWEHDNQHTIDTIAGLFEHVYQKGNGRIVN